MLGARSVAVMWHLLPTRYVAISISDPAVQQHKTERMRLCSNDPTEQKQRDQMGQRLHIS